MRTSPNTRENMLKSLHLFMKRGAHKRSAGVQMFDYIGGGREYSYIFMNSSSSPLKVLDSLSWTKKMWNTC